MFGFLRVCLSAMLLGTVIVPSSAPAQIAITSDDILGLIGKSQTMEFDTTESVAVDVGAAGESQTWDFRGVDLQATSTTNSFSSPDDTPFAGDFPDANFVQHFSFMFEFGDITIYNYFRVTSSELASLGNVTDFGDSVSVKVSDEVTALPLEFGDSWSGTSSDTTEASGSLFITTSTEESTIDAWGVVKLSIGDFDCLRLRTDRETITKIVSGGVEVPLDTTTHIEYVWFSKSNFWVATAESQEGETNPSFTEASTFQRISSTASSVQAPGGEALPSDFALMQNHPNPFNPETVIAYRLPERGRVTLEIYNLLGQKVRTLVRGIQSAGTHEARWDGTDDRGQPLSSGVYYYRLEFGDQSRVRKMVYLR